MANDVSAFLETLVAASGDFNAPKVGALSFLDGVYLDVRPEVARNGKTITISFPDVQPFTDQAGNDWTPEDVTPGFVQVVFNERPGKAILIRDFDQWQSATEIIEKFYKPMYNRGLEYFNARIAAQITTGNFNAYAPIQGLSPAKVSVADATRAWNALAGGKVPVNDPGMLGLFTHNDVHAAMLQDAAWTQESLVSAAIAKQAREAADLGVAFNFRKLWDQQSPKTSATLTGTLAVNDGSATVTGTGTSFTTQCAAYQNITFAGDPTGTPYRIKSVTSDTALVLASNYNGNGSNLAGSAATVATYTNVAMHKYAIALAVRPLELVNDGHVHSRLVMLAGIPFRVMLSYQHRNSGYLLSVDCGCAVKVIRPDFGVIVKS